jgi:ribosomal protein S9
MHQSVKYGPLENDTSSWFDDDQGEITVSEAAEIIKTIGEYEQDTRRVLIDYQQRLAREARQVERKRTGKILAAID